MSFDLRTRTTKQGYGVPNSRYAKGYHRGLDKGADGGEVAQWLSSGVVTQITRNDSIGTWVETTNELGVGGKYIGYGHTRAPIGLKVGDRVLAGADGPTVNGWGDDHGSDWDGPHVHVWTGNVSGDMGQAWGNDLDPAPIFSATPTRKASEPMFMFSIPNPDAAAKKTYPVVYVLITDEGRETKFTTSDASFATDIAVQVAGGRIRSTDRAFVDAIKNGLIASAPKQQLGEVTVKPDTDLLAAVKALLAPLTSLATKIDALPAEIDRYSDGKKQS